jgi:serine/threonine-protein kinase RsbT
MSMERRIYINNDLDVVTARLQARKMAVEMGFRTADQARISLAASELARVISWNADLPGEIVLSDTVQSGQQGLRLTCAVQSKFFNSDGKDDGASSTSQARRSLTGACQLVDESIVEEDSNQKALVTLIKWLR